MRSFHSMKFSCLQLLMYFIYSKLGMHVCGVYECIFIRTALVFVMWNTIAIRPHEQFALVLCEPNEGKSIRCHIITIDVLVVYLYWCIFKETNGVVVFVWAQENENKFPSNSSSSLILSSSSTSFRVFCEQTKTRKTKKKNIALAIHEFSFVYLMFKLKIPYFCFECEWN